MQMKSLNIKFKKLPNDLYTDHVEKDFLHPRDVGVPVRHNRKTYYLNYQGGYNTDSYLFESEDSFWVLSLDLDDFHSLEGFLKSSLDEKSLNLETGWIYFQGSQQKEEIIGNLKCPIYIAKRMATYVEHY